MDRDKAYLDWPVAPADKPYARIDGHHLHDLVSEIVGISTRYRDQGHQFWGRLEGTASDEESAKWMEDKLKALFSSC